MLTQWASWRWVLFVNVPIGLARARRGRCWCCPRPQRKTGHFDLAGALTSTARHGRAGLRLRPRGRRPAGATPRRSASFALGVSCCSPRSSLIELRAASPITPLRLFADRNRARPTSARLLLVAGMMGMFFFLTQFLQGVLGYSAARRPASRSCR